MILTRSPVPPLPPPSSVPHNCDNDDDDEDQDDVGSLNGDGVFSADCTCIPAMPPSVQPPSTAAVFKDEDGSRRGNLCVPLWPLQAK